MSKSFDRWILRTGFLVFLMLGVSAPAAATEVTFEFPNNTGQAANDLHVEFKQQAKPLKDPITRRFGAFKNANQTAGNKVDFSNGSVANGNSTEIEFESTSPKLTIKRWWWTNDGDRIGDIQTTLSFAMVTFDQSEIAVGELVTVELLAAAAPGSGGFYQVLYELETPDGAVMPMPAVDVSVPSGEVTHQQLWSAPLDEMGTYTIRFEAIDLETGDELTSGSSAVAVDTGTHPPPVEEEPLE